MNKAERKEAARVMMSDGPIMCHWAEWENPDKIVWNWDGRRMSDESISTIASETEESIFTISSETEEILNFTHCGRILLRGVDITGDKDEGRKILSGFAEFLVTASTDKYCAKTIAGLQARVKYLDGLIARSYRMIREQEDALRMLGADEPNAEPIILDLRDAVKAWEAEEAGEAGEVGLSIDEQLELIGDANPSLPEQHTEGCMCVECRPCATAGKGIFILGQRRWRDEGM